jgi:ribosomal protein S8
LALSPQQIIEGRHSGFIDRYNLAVQDGVFYFKLSGERRAEVLEALHYVSLSGNKMTAAVSDLPVICVCFGSQCYELRG